MSTFKIYQLTNPDSVIGFPFIALSEDNEMGVCIQYSENLLSVEHDFQDQAETDINSYLDDYKRTDRTFDLDVNQLEERLGLNSERPKSYSYGRGDISLDVAFHPWKTEPYEEITISEISPSALQLFQQLVKEFEKS